MPFAHRKRVAHGVADVLLGLGYGVVRDVGETKLPWSKGSFYWGGAYCTYFWVDPVEELIGIMMTQVRPYTHLNIRQDMVVLANQAIVD